MIAKSNNADYIGRKTFFVAWIVIAVVGVFINQLLVSSISSVLSAGGLIEPTLWVIAIAVVTLITQSIVGYLQSIAIRRYWGIILSQWWWMTGIGFAVGSLTANLIIPRIFLILPTLPGQIDILMVILFSAIIHAIFAAMAQIRLLKPHLNHTERYLLVMIGAGIASSFIMFKMPHYTHLTTIIYGASTGLALLWLDHITYVVAGNQSQVEPEGVSA